MFAIVESLIPTEPRRNLMRDVARLRWEDGLKTAGAGRSRKRNEQLTVQSAGARPHLQQLAQRVLKHPEVCAFAEPKRMSRILLGRYDKGCRYGPHNDAPITSGGGQGQARADVSFTIFLAEPDSYEGGSLCLHSPFGDNRIKGAAGSAVLYDTGLMHEVEEVTNGQRVVCVGWIESWIQDPSARAVLQDLGQGIRAAAAIEPEGEETVRLRRIRANLVRRWAK
jgi:PKHD-type hydroxylase